MSRPAVLRQVGNDGIVRPVVAVVGASALVLGLLAAFVPSVGDAVAAAVGPFVASPVLVVLVVLAGGLYAVVGLYRSGATEQPTDPLVGLNPERAHYGEHAVSGAGIDESVEAVGGELPESSATDWWTYREKNDVQTTLESVARRVLASEHDVSEAAAERLVETGAWTDEPRAASFLGDDVPELPLKLQFVDWLSGVAYQRRVEATVDAIARHAGVGADRDEAGRTATGSALPVHETPEADRVAAADDGTGAGSTTTAASKATSVADVRLGVSPDDRGASEPDADTDRSSTSASRTTVGDEPAERIRAETADETGDEAAATSVGEAGEPGGSGEATASPADVEDHSGEDQDVGERSAQERGVEVAAERGGEDS